LNVRPTIARFVLLLVIAFAFAIAVRYMPVQEFQISRDGPRAMVHTRRESYQYARRVLAALGGLPPDAQPDTRYSEMVSGAGLAPRRIADFYRWRHRDLLASSDFILVTVKERADGTMYASTIVRRWQALWQIALTQWFIRRHALPLPAPAVLKSSCSRGVDAAAVLRVLGSEQRYIASSHVRRRGEPEFLPPPLRSRTAAYARWNAPVSFTLKYEHVPVRARAVWISDGPTGQAYRLVMIDTDPEIAFPMGHVRHWMWLTFSSDDIEHVCRG
jgi:hypothetical protein